MRTITYLGPPGTFTEEALLSDPYLAGLARTPMPTITDVLDATAQGRFDLGFVPIENSIEGTVTLTIDSLVFEHQLLIQRETILPISMHLIGVPGATVDAVDTVISFPHAVAQCRRFLRQYVPSARVEAANSTADAVRIVAQRDVLNVAALGNRLAANLYGLEVLAADAADAVANHTRFMALARSGVPAETGTDKTSIVCFQHSDRPGSLVAILQQLAERSVNVTRLESRPTKRALGEYCFIIEFDGHVDDPAVAGTLNALESQLAGLKLLGSHPRAVHHGGGAAMAGCTTSPARLVEGSSGLPLVAQWTTQLPHPVRDVSDLRLSSAGTP